MAKLIVTTFLTLDGVMQAPGAPREDTTGNFKHGGWSVPYVDADMRRFMASVFSRADAFLLGRGTYEIFAGYWPRVTEPDDPIASALNRLPKHVASRTLADVRWNNSSLLRDVVTETPALKARYGRELQVHGSAGLVHALIQNDLVDEYNILVYPVVLGSGKRLFVWGAQPAAFQLVSTQTTSKGVVISTYQRAGAPNYGSLAREDEPLSRPAHRGW